MSIVISNKTVSNIQIGSKTVERITIGGKTAYDTAYIVATPVVSCTNNVVTMTCSTSGATIKYSTNGGSTWQTYSSSITISATTTYKAYATKSGMINSSQISYTATYVTPTLPKPTCTNSTSGTTTTLTMKTPGISGVTYYIRYKVAQTTSSATVCSNISDPEHSGLSRSGTGNDSTATYVITASRSTQYAGFKIIGTKSGYNDSEITCYRFSYTSTT